MSSIWYEKYKPQNLDELIIPESMRNALKEEIKNETLPNLGLWSVLPGLGKSSTANAIIKELNGEALWINASLEKGIDTLRGKIQTFASQSSFDDKIKIVVMDECLEENEEVVILENNNIKYKRLNTFEKNKKYDCLSFNTETKRFEKDTCEIISDKESEIYEVQLFDGRIIKVTDNHPFMIMRNNKIEALSIKDGLKVYHAVVVLRNKDGRYYQNLAQIYSIKKLEGKYRVINLTVHKNHTFITKNGIVTHNCDHISQDSQAAFRGFLDEFSICTRFIFTGNYKTKIIQPLLDRLENYEYSEFNPKDIIPQLFSKLKFIAENESLDITDEQIKLIIKNNYPKIRSMIGLMQTYKQSGVFKLNTDDYYQKIVQSLKDKDYDKMYKAVNELNDPDSIYQFFYNHHQYLNDLSKGVIILAKYQAMAPMVRDKYLNACACMLELMFLK